MKKMIVLDLDGTLLTSDKKIGEKTKNILEKLKNDGSKIVIATGRSKDGAINYYNELGLNTPLITHNGSLISFKDKSITKNLPKEELKEILIPIKKHTKCIILNQKDGICGYNLTKEIEMIFNGIELENVKILDFNNIPNDALNSFILINGEKREEFEKLFINDTIKYRYWGTKNDIAFYDLYLDGISKFSAIEEVRKQYKISEDNLITFGDSENDIEMLSGAEIGVAMKNASEKVKKCAKYVTNFDNDNDGIADFLLNFLKIK